MICPESHGLMDDLQFVERPAIQRNSEKGSDSYGWHYKFASAFAPIGYRAEGTSKLRGDSHSRRSAGSR